MWNRLDESIVETIVNTNEITNDDSSYNVRPFDESSYSAMVARGSVGLHNAYIAVATFAAAIFIVAMAVSIYEYNMYMSNW